MNNELSSSEKWHDGHCYCGVFDRDPKLRKKEGLPPGYCGLCDVCGRPGHTLHFPGSVPYTGSWCKFHYYRAMILHPNGAVGFYLWGVIVLGGIVALAVRLFR